MKQQFKQGFSGYAYIEDTIETTAGKIIVVAKILRDEDTTIDDDYYSQDMTGCTDEQQAEIERVRDAWYSNEWFYCGIVLSVYYENEHTRIELHDHAASLWGIECNYPGSDNSYLTEVANDMLSEAIEEGQIALDSLRNVINN